jgi:hypothetical protein
MIKFCNEDLKSLATTPLVGSALDYRRLVKKADRSAKERLALTPPSAPPVTSAPDSVQETQ